MNPRSDTIMSRDATARPRRSLAVQPLSEVLGAEIIGVDLTAPMSEAVKTEIVKAFLRYHLVIVRAQRLQRQHLYAFARAFGEIEPHAVAIRDADGGLLAGVHTITNLDANGKPVARPPINSNYFWHSDKSYLRTPSLATMLHAVEIPPSGGDTQFANMIRAHEALPDELKRKIDKFQVVHSLDFMRRYTGNLPPTDEEKLNAPPVVHPLVRTHPETGEKSLYIGMYSSHILELPEDEGRQLLEQLLEHATQPQFVFTQQWRPGDLVFWDNRCLLHRAVANFDMGAHRRVLMRVVVRGDVPR